MITQDCKAQYTFKRDNIEFNGKTYQKGDIVKFSGTYKAYESFADARENLTKEDFELLLSRIKVRAQDALRRPAMDADKGVADPVLRALYKALKAGGYSDSEIEGMSREDVFEALETLK